MGRRFRGSTDMHRSIARTYLRRYWQSHGPRDSQGRVRRDRKPRGCKRRSPKDLREAHPRLAPPKDFLKNPRGYLHKAAVNAARDIMRSRESQRLTDHPAVPRQIQTRRRRASLPRRTECRGQSEALGPPELLLPLPSVPAKAVPPTYRS